MTEFKVGDRVKVAKDARYRMYGSPGTAVSSAAGLEAVVVFGPGEYTGNYSVASPDRRYTSVPVLPKYLTLLEPGPEPEPFTDLPNVEVRPSISASGASYYRAGDGASMLVYHDEDVRKAANDALEASREYYAIYKALMGAADSAVEAAAERVLAVADVSREDALKIVEEFGLVKND